MAKRQIDLFGNEISPSKTKEIEKALANKLEGDAGKVIAYFKKNGDILSLVKDKKHRSLQKYANTLSSRDFMEVRGLIKLLDGIYTEEQDKNHKFKYFEKSSTEGTKTIFRKTISGLTPLYHELIAETNELEQFRAFFETLEFFVESVYNHIELVIESLLDRYGGTLDDYQEFCQELYQATDDYLKHVSIDYEENPEVKARVAFNGYISLSFRITKFY